MTQKQKTFIGLLVIGILLVVGVASYLFYRGVFRIGANVGTTSCLTVLNPDSLNLHEGEIGATILGVKKECSPESAYNDYDYMEAINPASAELISMAKVKLANYSLGDISAYREYGFSFYPVGVSVSAGSAASFQIKLKESGGFSFAKETIQYNILAHDTGKLTVAPGWQWIFNKDTISYTIAGGTSPYTFAPTEVSKPVFDGTTSWQPVTGADQTALYTASGAVSFVGNVMKVTGGDQMAVVVGNITDKSGKTFSVNYLNLPNVKMAFNETQTVALGQAYARDFTRSDLLGEPAYRVMPDNSLISGISKYNGTSGKDAYYFYGASEGSARVLVMGQITGATTHAQGADYFKDTKVGIINVKVTGEQTACNEGDFAFAFTPNVWNIKTYTFSPNTGYNTIYKLFTFLGAEKPVSAFTYVGTGAAYEENGAVTPGQGFWFNSGVQSPVCVPKAQATANGSKSVTLNGSLVMVGNPTTSAIKWDSVKIKAGDKQMSIFEATRQAKPIVKAIYDWPSTGENYLAYISNKYPDMITGGAKSIDTLKGRNWESGKGYWFALNSGIQSVTFEF